MDDGRLPGLFTGFEAARWHKRSSSSAAWYPSLAGIIIGRTKDAPDQPGGDDGNDDAGEAVFYFDLGRVRDANQIQGSDYNKVVYFVGRSLQEYYSSKNIVHKERKFNILVCSKRISSGEAA